MQSLDVINMRAQAVEIPGLGTVSAGARKTGFVDDTLFNADFDAYKDRTMKIGILVRDGAASPQFTPSAYESITGIATIANATRAVVATGGSAYALTLMAASAVPVDTVLYFYYLSGANDVTITRAGSDTINGGTTLVLNASNPVRRLRKSAAATWVNA
jgi:hypothetical protein